MNRIIVLWSVSILCFLVNGCMSERDLLAEHDSSYYYPLASPGSKFGALPPPVQNTGRAEAGAAEIIDVQRVGEAQQLAYRIDFRNPEVYPPLFVSADGSVLHPDLQPAVGAPADTF